MNYNEDRATLWQFAMDERARVRATLAGLAEPNWDAPTLCTGWRVRDVAAHLAAQANQSTVGFLAGMAAAGFNVDRFNAAGIRRWREASPAQLVAALGHDKALLFFRRNPQQLLLEYVVHHLDITEALGGDAQIPARHLHAAAMALGHMSDSATTAVVLRLAGRLQRAAPAG